MGHAEQSLDEMLSSEEKDLLVDLVRAQREGRISRRGLLAMLGGAGVGAGAVLAGTDRAAGDPSTSDSYGNVGLPNDRVDVFADGIDLETTLEGNGTVKTDVNNQSVSTDKASIGKVVADITLSSNQEVSSGSMTQIAFDNALDDEYGNFDSSTNSYDIPEDGKYTINAEWLWVISSDKSTGESKSAKIEVNGTREFETDRAFVGSSTSNESDRISVTGVKLSQNDTITIHAEQATGSQQDIFGDSGFTRWQIVREG